jgi:putative FmdB family regulatory protein
MPVYAYRCESCGVHFERQQSFNDPPLKRCPECNKNSLRKVIGPVGVVFKGSGFYSTDNRSTSGLATPKSEKSEKDNTETKTETKTDSEKKEKGKE